MEIPRPRIFHSCSEKLFQMLIVGALGSSGCSQQLGRFEDAKTYCSRSQYIATGDKICLPIYVCRSQDVWAGSKMWLKEP